MARARRRAFTLIELIVVMFVLTTTLAICAPRLSSFVKGRRLTEESRRFLALTRYGRSEAASRGVPMRLWIDAQEGKYGLESAPGFAQSSDQPLAFTLGEGLKFEVDATSTAADSQGRQSIVFGPDGDIDSASVADVTIREDEKHAVEISRTAAGMAYEIREPES